jgi:hypothetical protein
VGWRDGGGAQQDGGVGWRGGGAAQQDRVVGPQVCGAPWVAPWATLTVAS